MDSDDVRAAVITAGKRHYAAASAGDAAAVAELFCDDVLYSHSNGLREGKGAYLERVESGMYRELKIEHEPDHVWVLGDVAVVAATQASTGKVGHYEWPEPKQSVSLDVWCRRDGRWQLLAHHMTLLQTS